MNDLSKLFDHFANNYVGFDQIRKHFANIEAATRIPSFPPLNIYREGPRDDKDFSAVGDYVFELALSGYKPADVQISLEKVQGVNLLTVRSEGTIKDAKDCVQWINRGIAGRAFTLSYTLADFVEVKSAVMKDGLLTIRLAVVTPEQNTVKQIPILCDENITNVTALETPVAAKRGK